MNLASWRNVQHSLHDFPYRRIRREKWQSSHMWESAIKSPTGRALTRLSIINRRTAPLKLLNLSSSKQSTLTSWHQPQKTRKLRYAQATCVNLVMRIDDQRVSTPQLGACGAKACAAELGDHVLSPPRPISFWTNIVPALYPKLTVVLHYLNPSPVAYISITIHLICLFFRQALFSLLHTLYSS